MNDMKDIEDTTVLRHVRDHVTRAIRSEPTLEGGFGTVYGIGWRHRERVAILTEGPDGVFAHLNTTAGDTANVDVPTPDPQQAITVVLRHLTGQEGQA